MKKTEKTKRMNAGLFLSMFLLSIVQKFYLLIPGIVLCIIGIWVPSCAKIGIIFIGVDIVISLVWMLYGKNMIENSDSEPLDTIRDSSLKGIAEHITDIVENEPPFAPDEKNGEDND